MTHYDYHATLLPKLNPREKYVYVVTLPDRFDEQFERQDPKGRIIRFAPDYSVFIN